MSERTHSMPASFTAAKRYDDARARAAQLGTILVQPRGA
jgi:hypothetical protein